MKHIKALSLLLALTLTLTACKENDGRSSEVNESLITQSTPQSTSSAAQSTSIPEEISEPDVGGFPVVIYPKMTVKTDGELAEIAAVLGEFGRFYGTYLSMELYQDYLFEKNADRFTEEVTVNNKTYDETYVKVSKCGITTFSAMTEKLNSLFTENCLDETSERIREWFRAGENDELYVRRIGAGGYLGESYLRINKISRPDDVTITVDMSVIGEAEDWGYDEDLAEDLTVTLKRENDGLKIDSFGGDKHHLISFIMSFVQYKNVFFTLDNITEFELQREAEDADNPNKYYRPLNETEEILKLLEDYADFYLAMTPTMNIERYIDKTQKISVERTNVSGEPYTLEYYKTVGLPANTLDELNEKLDGIVGEELKNDFLKMTDNRFFTVAENGGLYMSADPYGRSLGLGMDALYLDSIEYPDENTVLITVTSFGAKENWDADKDIISKATAKLVRTSDGLRIEACDVTIPDYFGYYNELVLGELPR